MPRVRCPDCDARFSATGRRAECPDCGYRFRLDPDDERDERDVRRSRRAKYSSGKNLVPLLIVGGAVGVVFVFGVIGLVVFSVITRGREEARRPNAAAPAPMFDAPGDAPNLAPLVNGPPQPSAPPLIDSGPKTGANSQPTVPGQWVTLSNLRRGGGGGFGPPAAFSVDYAYAAGSSPNIFDVLVVSSGGERVGTVDLTGPRPRADTISVRSFGPRGGALNGAIEVWMERRNAPAPFGGRGDKISNSLTLK